MLCLRGYMQILATPLTFYVLQQGALFSGSRFIQLFFTTRRRIYLCFIHHVHVSLYCIKYVFIYDIIMMRYMGLTG